ncbi:MAG: VWA domain-containing protein, partial [Burkholderiaceae bacterium]|nr:VWA domain-containing protein [Burkholderiaceae bacterium]
MPWRRIPAHVDDDRLLGGLDLPATLASGRPVARRGLLVELDGGVALVPMAERLAPALAAHLARALDLAEVAVERAGMTLRASVRLAVVALDEGVEDESVPAVLADRLAIWAVLPAATRPLAEALAQFADERIAAARARLPAVQADADPLAALCGTAMALGIASLRAPLSALRVACAHAALAGRAMLTDDDLAVAARLVLAGRATVPPPRAEAAPATEPPARSREEAQADGGGEVPQDLLVQAALAHLPPHVLQSRERARARGVRAPAGRSGARSASGLRGRPHGIRQGAPRRGERLALVATLYAAAPWQRLRRRERGALGRRARFEVRGEDLRALRFAQRTPTTTLFVVDASGSTAAQRLAEAKGAVELLLAECYVRRDRVALIAFRGQGAALLLPPTRSLVRARREL